MTQDELIQALKEAEIIKLDPNARYVLAFKRGAISQYEAHVLGGYFTQQGIRLMIVMLDRPKEDLAMLELKP